ncbi:MAG: MBL fold metallo-hydrolase [Acidimicrobiales bacterium]|nr:MBL fold metallo-hydrolase [Acidimicrobiales bacterium]
MSVPAPIPFVTLEPPTYGEVVQVAPMIRRVIARNPSKFSYHGTGTYLIGDGDHVTLIDPGPRDDAHAEALLTALGGQRLRTILVTHCHGDHSPLAARLAAETGAITVGFGPHPRPDASDLADDPDDEPDDPDEPDDDGSGAAAPVVLEEPTDYAFDPHERVVDGDVAAAGPGYTMRALHTPGHTSNHLCFTFDEERALFSGDHVMGWSTTVIAPPDGDMRHYLESLRRVMARHDQVLWPTHGAPITDPGPFLDAFLAHRLHREAQVLAAVREGQTNIAAMVRVLYADVRRQLHKPARRSVLAHLVKLVDDGAVVTEGGERPSLRSVYRPG